MEILTSKYIGLFLRMCSLSLILSLYSSSSFIYGPLPTFLRTIIFQIVIISFTELIQLKIKYSPYSYTITFNRKYKINLSPEAKHGQNKKINWFNEQFLLILAEFVGFVIYSEYMNYEFYHCNYSIGIIHFNTTYIITTIMFNQEGLNKLMQKPFNKALEAVFQIICQLMLLIYFQVQFTPFYKSMILCVLFLFYIFIKFHFSNLASRKDNSIPVIRLREAQIHQDLKEDSSTLNSNQRANYEKQIIDQMNDAIFISFTDTLEMIYTNSAGNKLLFENNLSFQLLCQKLLIKKQNSLETFETKLNNLINFDGLDSHGREYMFSLTTLIDSNLEDTPRMKKRARTYNLKTHMYRVKIVLFSEKKIMIKMKLQKEKEQKIITESLKKILTTTLSHEVKTLLNGVIGNIELLRDDLKKEQVIFQKIALSSANLLNCKFSDLIDFLQIENNEFEVHKEEFAIENLLTELQEMMKPLAKQKQLNFVTKKNILLSKNYDF
jgi:K+-sensing histidine kinase KdpD